MKAADASILWHKLISPRLQAMIISIGAANGQPVSGSFSFDKPGNLWVSNADAKPQLIAIPFDKIIDKSGVNCWGLCNVVLAKAAENAGISFHIGCERKTGINCFTITTHAKGCNLTEAMLKKLGTEIDKIAKLYPPKQDLKAINQVQRLGKHKSEVRWAMAGKSVPTEGAFRPFR